MIGRPFTGYDFTLIRYRTNGKLDNGFGDSGVVYTSYSYGSNVSDVAEAAALQSDEGLWHWYPA